jgi:hypothetical protein
MRGRWVNAIEREANGGWSDWMPMEATTRIACCDCGLVHDLEISIADDGSGVMKFRAKRHNRSTAQRRRHMDKPS